MCGHHRSIVQRVIGLFASPLNLVGLQLQSESFNNLSDIFLLGGICFLFFKKIKRFEFEYIYYY